MKRIEIPINREELSGMLRRMSFDEIEDRLWQLYSIIGAIAGTHTTEAEVGEIKITSSLPKKGGDVSIMMIEDLYKALEDATPFADGSSHIDPTPGYDMSTFYVYAIDGDLGTIDSTLSTPDNLKTVGIKWYMRFNKPIKHGTRWAVGASKLFGGPLNTVDRNSDGKYIFGWYYSDGGCDYSSCSDHWVDSVTGNTYVAVVHS